MLRFSAKLPLNQLLWCLLGIFSQNKLRHFENLIRLFAQNHPFLLAVLVFFLLIRQNEMGCYLSTVRICCECCDKLLLVDLSHTWQLLDEPREVGNFSILDNLRFMVKALCQAFERVQVYLLNKRYRNITENVFFCWILLFIAIKDEQKVWILFFKCCLRGKFYFEFLSTRFATQSNAIQIKYAPSPLCLVCLTVSPTLR